MYSYYEFEFCSFWVFSPTPLKKKLGVFYSAFHAIKKWLLTNFVFFCFLEIVLFFRNHTISCTFLYVIILILVHASAIFAKHWHVPTDGPINGNFFTVGQQTPGKRAWCLTYVLFFESTTFRKRQKGLFSTSLLMTKFSDNSRRCLSPALFNKILAQWRKEFENYAKLQTKVSSNCSCGHVKRCFDIFARNFIQKAELFSFSVQTCWRKNLFFLESSSQMVLPDRYIPALSNPQKKIVLTAKFFFAQFSHLRKTSFFSKENSFLKMPLGQVDNYFDNPLD